MIDKRKEVGYLLKSYLQRPYYWSWGGVVANTTNKWPKKEDKFKKTVQRTKPTKIQTDVLNTSLFTEEAYETDFSGKKTGGNASTRSGFVFDDITSVLPTRSTAIYYQLDRKQPKWNFNLSISDSNDVNVTRTSEVNIHNKTVILITGNTFLPKIFNETLDYGSYSAGGNWSNGTDYESNYTGTISLLGNYDAIHLAAMVATAIILGLIILATVIVADKNPSVN